MCSPPTLQFLVSVVVSKEESIQLYLKDSYFLLVKGFKEQVFLAL